MEADSMTPAPAGNAPMSLDQGGSAILSRLTASAKTTPEPAKEREPKPDEADEASQEVETADTDSETSEAEAGTPTDEDEAHSEPTETVFRLPDGRELTPDQVIEWEKGYLRQSDYTRKTQEAAELRKQAEARAAEAAQRAKALDDQITLAIQVATQYLPPEPPREMMETDPIGFFQMREARAEKIAEIQQMMQMQNQHRQQQAADQAKEFEAWQAKQAETLLAKLPKLKDPKVLQEFQKDVTTYLPYYGYTQDDLKQVYDHRLVSLIDDAVAYRKLMATKPKAQEKVKNVTPVAQPGKRATNTDARAKDYRDAVAKLRNTNSVDDGAMAILNKLKLNR